MSEITQIIIYSRSNCIFCVKAMVLLKKLSLEYIEKKSEDYSDKEKLFEDIGKVVKTMPQIKINGELIGGYNSLVEYFTDKGLINFKGEVI